MANKLNEEHNKLREDNQKAMSEQAQKRLAELEKMKLDQEESFKKKMDDKKKLLEIQKEDQSIKYQDRENFKRMSQSVNGWDNTNVLSYVFENKEHKAHKYKRRIDNIYNHYSDKLTVEKQDLLKKEAEIL